MGGGGVVVGLRAEETALAGKHSDEDVVALGDFAEELGDAEVVVLNHGIELLFQVEGDDGHLATGLEEDGFFGSGDRHVGGCCLCLVWMWWLYLIR